MTRVSSRTLQAEGGQAFEVVHAKILKFFPDLVLTLGGDPLGLMLKVGIQARDQALTATDVTYRQVLDLLETAATELRCPDFGLRLATLQSGRVFGPLGAVMMNSRTFGEALDYVTNHSPAHSPAARIWLRRWPDHGAVFVGHDVLLDQTPHRSQAMEQLLLVGHLSASEITAGGARARKIYFRHQPVSSPRTYQRYFGCEVLFGQKVDGVVYLERDLAAPIATRNAGGYEAATSLIDAKFSRQDPPLRAEVRGVIMRFLGTRLCRSERVAAELDLAPQTMARRLKAEGSSFQQIKDEVRRDLMIYYLQATNLDFGRISERLGFAEQSVMTRNCNRWFLASPTKLRSTAQHAASGG
ncbi:AraC family transcriptional regulator [Caulobacter soli]|uniref:AraC family transcriptional regulator n=1 Tax=Caulobacter soli TaxID=2708539 RepID=UPI00196AE944|nr:AraC family transcriptional regulator [Caulobacter soli]